MVLLALLSASAATAQTRWSRDEGGAGNDEAQSIALDPAGNAYLVGQFGGSAKFGNITLVGVGSYSSFLVKYDAQGVALWGQVANGAASFSDTAVDADGNAYAVGSFSGSVSIGGQTLTSLGNLDMLLVKYDGQGKLLWCRQGGSQPGSRLSGARLAIDKQGNAFVTGTLSGMAMWGGGSVTSESPECMYLMSYGVQGDARWSQLGGGKDSQSRGGGVGLDAAGNVYVAGSFFGTATLGASSLTNQGGVLVAKCDATGKFSWAAVDNGGGNTGSSGYSDIAVDDQGNSVITGSMDGRLLCGAFTLNSAGGQDGYVIKRDAEGQVLWANRIGGNDTDYGTSVALDGLGNVYATGIFASAPAQFGSASLTHVGGKNAFIVKYDPQGKVVAVQREGACGGTFSRGIAVSAAQEVYITGTFSGFASFVSTVFESRDSSGDVFLAKAGDLTTPSTPDDFNCTSVAPPTPAPTPPSPTPVPTPPPSSPPAPTPPPVLTPVPIPAPIPAPTPAPAPVPTSLELMVPNVLTPNGDGLNDKFKPAGLADNLWSLTIYTRWGQRVYQSAAYQQDWDATGLPAGAYYYLLRHATGREYKGWVEVVR